MLASQKIAILLVATLGLTGCANYIKIGDQFVKYLSNYANPNRPLPPQPQVSAEVKSVLAKKPLHQIPILIGDVVYYNEGPLINKTIKKATVINFTKDSKEVSHPSAEVVVSSFSFLKAFRKHLQDNGFKVVDQSCDECLRLDVDFSTFTLDADSLTPITVIFVRIRISYKNMEVLKTRDDWSAGRKKPPLGPKESDIAQTMAAIIMTEELIQAWAIAIKGEKATEGQRISLLAQ